MIEANKINKSFGTKTVFDDLTFSLEPGTYALQGANGCGKTTLLNILAGAMEADSGSINIAGRDLIFEPLAARRALGFAPDESPIYPFMRGRDLLELVRRAKDVELDETVRSLIKAFKLNVHLDTRFDSMSLGTQKKLLLVAAFVGNSPVILADEPSNGLDIDSRTALAGAFSHADLERTVLFTSHDQDFVVASNADVITMEELCSLANRKD